MKNPFTKPMVYYVLLSLFIATTCDASQCPTDQIPKYANKPIIVINNSAWDLRVDYKQLAGQSQKCPRIPSWSLAPGRRTIPEQPCSGCELIITGPGGFNYRAYSIDTQSDITCTGSPTTPLKCCSKFNC
jgi:hypothetical protein